MLRLFLAAMLAAVASHAQAATFIKYTGHGTGTWTELDIVDGSIERTFGYFSIEILMPELPGACIAGLDCYWSEEGMRFLAARDEPYRLTILLNYSDGLDAPRTTALGFTGGTIESTRFEGRIDRLLVGVVESDNPNDANGRFEFSEFVPIPEPATWAMMIAGFGLLGGALRRQQYAINVGVVRC